MPTRRPARRTGRDGTSTLGTTIVMPQVHPPGGPKTFASKHVRDEGRSGSPSPRCTLRGPSHDGKGDAAGSAHAVRAASASCACLAAGPSGRTHSLFTMSNNTLRPEARAMRRLDGPAANFFDADGLEAPVGCRSTVPLRSIAQGDGGARRDRTDDLMLAKHALYRLSYCPVQGNGFAPWGAAPVRAGRRWPRRSARRPTGGPGKTRTSDLTLIKRAL